MPLYFIGRILTRPAHEKWRQGWRRKDFGGPEYTASVFLVFSGRMPKIQGALFSLLKRYI
jgi:hypothetical protein